MNLRRPQRGAEVSMNPRLLHRGTEVSRLGVGTSRFAQYEAVSDP